MHFSPISALVALVVPALASFKAGCAEAAWDSQVDFWNHKFEGETEIPFFPEYNNTYVRIKNRQARYVVLYCSRDAPPQESPYWSVLASDASSQIVNMSSDASGASINVAADEAASPLATQTWALIDTTQHLSGQGTDVPRVDAARWSDLAGINSDSYAVRSNNVWLSDRQTNRNRTHNFFAHGPTRPDLVLQDLISIIKPEFQANYQPTFLRRADRPDDFEAQRRTASSCTAPDAAVSSLQVGSCSLPAWAKGYHSSGVSNNAYGRDEEVESLALTSGRSDTLNGGEIAGVVIGIVADVALVGAAVVLVRRRKQKKRQEVQEVKGPVKEVDGGSLSSGGMA